MNDMTEAQREAAMDANAKRIREVEAGMEDCHEGIARARRVLEERECDLHDRAAELDELEARLPATPRFRALHDQMAAALSDLERAVYSAYEDSVDSNYERVARLEDEHDKLMRERRSLLSGE